MKLDPLRSFDLVVLVRLALVEDDEPWSEASLAEELDASQEEIRGALSRAAAAHLYSSARHSANRRALVEFIEHAVYYVFPTEAQRVDRRPGLPTAWSAPPLRDQIAASDDAVAVWPESGGPATGGFAIEPLDPRVVGISRRNSKMHEALALVDAIRAGRRREMALAKAELGQRLR